MKKVIAILLMAALALCAGLCEEQTVSTVYVTVVNGDILLAQAAVELTDADGDGLLTMNDALWAAHDAYYEGGAEAGYSYENTDYGISLLKLWGVDNGGAYGYYLNNASAMSLKDEVRDGDLISAFVYTDLDFWSDTYCWFEVAEEENTLQLFTAGWDENWAPVASPCAGAFLVVDGERTGLVTDEEGKVQVNLSEEHIISALSDEMNLVPPVWVSGR